MRFGSYSLLLVLGVTGIIGCGGGGSGAATSSRTSEGAYDPVPSIDALPPTINPTTYEAPPSTYDMPPGQTYAGGIGAGPTVESVCSQLCGAVLALHCPIPSDASQEPGPMDNGNGNPRPGPMDNGNQDPQEPPAPAATTIVSPEECTALCVQAEAKEPCPSELAAGLSCILDHFQLSCSLFSDTSDQQKFDDQLAVSCQTALVEYARCRSAYRPICGPGSCGAREDRCERCLCENDGDTQSCRMCPQ